MYVDYRYRVKMNLGKYLRLAESEDIFITKMERLSPSCQIPMPTVLKWQNHFSA